MKNTVSRLVLAALVTVSASASAEVLNFTIKGTGSGSLAGVSFSDQAFSFNMSADTANFGASGMASFDPMDSASATINGFGTSNFGIATRLGQAGNVIYFSRAGNGGLDLFDFYIPQGIALNSVFGPVAATNIFALNQFSAVATSNGALTFNSAHDVTFQAAAVPEPESWAMMLAGLGAIGMFARRKKAQQLTA